MIVTDGAGHLVWALQVVALQFKPLWSGGHCSLGNGVVKRVFSSWAEIGSWLFSSKDI